MQSKEQKLDVLINLILTHVALNTGEMRTVKLAQIIAERSCFNTTENLIYTKEYMTIYNNITYQLFPIHRTRFLHKLTLHNTVFHRLPITEIAVILPVPVIFTCNNSSRFRPTSLPPTHNPQDQKCQESYSSNADQCACDLGAHCPNFRRCNLSGIF